MFDYVFEGDFFIVDLIQVKFVDANKSITAD